MQSERWTHEWISSEWRAIGIENKIDCLNYFCAKSICIFCWIVYIVSRALNLIIFPNHGKQFELTFTIKLTNKSIAFEK